MKMIQRFPGENANHLVFDQVFRFPDSQENHFQTPCTGYAVQDPRAHVCLRKHVLAHACTNKSSMLQAWSGSAAILLHQGRSPALRLAALAQYQVQ